MNARIEELAAVEIGYLSHLIEKHVDAPMLDSAKVCHEDALKLATRGDAEDAIVRAAYGSTYINPKYRETWLSLRKWYHGL